MLRERVKTYCDDLGVQLPSRSEIATKGKEWYQNVFPDGFKNETKNDYFADIICGLTVGEALEITQQLPLTQGALSSVKNKK